MFMMDYSFFFWLFFFCFFFKQKTAYEMRISDWSSDVALPICLPAADGGLLPHPGAGRPEGRQVPLCGHQHPAALPAAPDDPAARSEEHTSELQSLMRISYAVFCLKKKNTRHRTNKIVNTDDSKPYNESTKQSHTRQRQR